MIKRIKKTVLDVIKQKPEDRSKADVLDLVKKYLITMPAFEPFDDAFFSQLHLECRVESDFERSQVIRIKPDTITIVYQGKAY